MNLSTIFNLYMEYRLPSLQSKFISYIISIPIVQGKLNVNELGQEEGFTEDSNQAFRYSGGEGTNDAFLRSYRTLLKPRDLIRSPRMMTAKQRQMILERLSGFH